MASEAHAPKAKRRRVITNRAHIGSGGLQPAGHYRVSCSPLVQATQLPDPEANAARRRAHREDEEQNGRAAHAVNLVITDPADPYLTIPSKSAVSTRPACFT